MLAKKSKDRAEARRLLSLPAIYEGDNRTQAAAIGKWMKVIPHASGLQPVHYPGANDEASVIARLSLWLDDRYF
jgi:hypothetical protein